VVALQASGTAAQVWSSLEKLTFALWSFFFDVVSSYMIIVA
jgi:hypothetical protein